MLDFGIPAKLVRLTKMTMTNSVSQVRTQKGLTDTFYTRNGLKQGDGLTPILFNIALEYVIRKLSVDDKGTMITKTTQIVAHADDINILSRSFPRSREIMINLDKAAKEVRLRINENKTKIMTQTRRRTPRRQNSTIGEYKVENVEKFTYLGTILSTDANENDEIKGRLHTANRAYYSLLPIIKSRYIHRKTKIRIYKTIIRTIMCYGSETWMLTQTSEKMVNTFERKILRRILGPIQDRDGWRSRYNSELYSIFDEPEISTVMRFRRLQWAGHVQRMEDGRIPKKILKERIFGTRPIGKPRRRWEDAVNADSVSMLGVRNWKTRALDRDDEGVAYGKPRLETGCSAFK